MKRHLLRRADGGFTMVEALLATLIMGVILSALATLTAQWLPNWNRGFARVQRGELFVAGLERLVSDLSAAQVVPLARVGEQPYFDGAELAVTFVRTTIGPNATPGLEIVKIAEIAGERGPTLVRTTAPYAPSDPDGRQQPNFANPVVVIRPPNRIVFSYAGPDRAWKPTWQGARELPRAIRLSVRDADGRPTPLSTSAEIHAEVSVRCVGANPPQGCPQSGPRPPQNNATDQQQKSSDGGTILQQETPVR